MKEQLTEESKLEKVKRLWNTLIKQMEECENNWIDLTFSLSDPTILDNLNIRVQKLFCSLNPRGKDFYWFLEKLSEQRERSFKALLQVQEKKKKTKVL